jgi:Amt family ammonium transporter
VHLACGLWGTFAVVFTNADATIGGQLAGILIIGAFVFGVSAMVWYALHATMGIRVSAEEEMTGLDAAELGMEAYPEFGKGSQFA